MGKGKRYILLVIAIALLLVIPIGYKKTSNLAPELVVKKAYAATMEIKSVHSSMSVTVTGWDEQNGSIEIDFLYPDRMRMVVEQDGERHETRFIGDKAYERDSQTGEWMVQEGRATQAALVSMQRFAEGAQPKSIAERLKGLEDIEELPDEVINGVTCVHYRGRIDPIKGFKEQLAEESEPRTKEALQQILEVQEQMEMTIMVDVWIGKDDYLLWQQRVIQSYKVLPGTFDDQGVPALEGTTMTITTFTEFSTFKKPMEIEAPF